MASEGGGAWGFAKSIRRIKLTNLTTAVLLSVGGLVTYTVSNSRSDGKVVTPDPEPLALQIERLRASDEWYYACAEKAAAAAAEARAAANEAKAAAAEAKAVAEEVKAVVAEIKAALAGGSS